MKKIKIIILTTLIFLICSCSNESTYKVNIDDKKINLCDKEINLVDYTYNNEFDINKLIEEVNYCNNELEKDKQFYKDNYINLAEEYNDKLHELGIDEWIFTDTSR